VKRERLSFLTDSALHTQRFAYYVGWRCRSATIKDIASELHLGWDSVKELDKHYMRAQLARAAPRGPRRSASTKSRSARATPTGSW
jgi:hypothetical protein